MENLVETNIETASNPEVKNEVAKSNEVEHNRRWYDKKKYTSNVLGILKNLSMRSHYEIAREVIRVVESIKIHNRELDELPLSIGVDRVLGLFQEQHKRRWYDNSLPLSRCFKTTSTLQEEDFQNIMQGVCISLKGDELDD